MKMKKRNDNKINGIHSNVQLFLAIEMHFLRKIAHKITMK